VKKTRSSSNTERLCRQLKLPIPPAKTSAPDWPPVIQSGVTRLRQMMKPDIEEELKQRSKAIVMHGLVL
jgi:hypothetical protein